MNIGFFVYPVVVGSGKRLFKDGIDKKVLKLIDTKTFSSGVVALTYQPEKIVTNQNNPHQWFGLFLKK